MKTKIAALMIALMTVCATYAQYYSGKVGETISLPNPSTPAGYNGILESTYSSDSKYLSVYSGTSSVKILSYVTGRSILQEGSIITMEHLLHIIILNVVLLPQHFSFWPLLMAVR